MEDPTKELHTDRSVVRCSTYMLIVSGACGSGKSTAVEKALEMCENTACHGT